MKSHPHPHPQSSTSSHPIHISLFILMILNSSLEHNSHHFHQYQRKDISYAFNTANHHLSPYWTLLIYCTPSASASAAASLDLMPSAHHINICWFIIACVFCCCVHFFLGEKREILILIFPLFHLFVCLYGWMPYWVYTFVSMCVFHPFSLLPNSWKS